MARKKPMTFNCPESLLIAFKNICDRTGASYNHCMERVLTEVVKVGNIPGIDPMGDHLEREREKYGSSVVPVVGLDEQPNVGAPELKRKQPVK